ncbi:AAA family ATPase [Actinokineospora fastidiosa]|uniref:Transcriptional regulator n=1 Tax=Actinokineospora fastidiosa TaxID=1816 RepID=A0A918G3H0_9PSEU|nr:AAA family ATPase [Actinokineospora fastidiosa]GGS16354.1 transcriptional regulator [Actinokineospora fastidiosa]
MVRTDHDTALTELMGLFEDCRAGHGGLALITGGLASGKTRLLNRFCAHAREAGALLLTATGSRAERALRAGVIDQLFHGAGLPPAVADRMSRVVSPRADEESGSDARTMRQGCAMMVHEVCSAVLELSRERPVVLGIDDVQFADSSSLQFILYLRKRMASARVLIALTEWEQPQPTLPVFHAEITRRQHHRIGLAPLSEAGIAALLPDRPDLAPVWHRVSGGNPMLVQAMADDLAAGITADDERAGPAYGRAVLACLHRWEPYLLDVARAVAVLGDERDRELVARLAGTTPDVADRAERILTGAGLLTDGGFRHAAAAAAVLAAMPVAQRSTMHTVAAELRYQRGAAASTVAAHLLAADRVVAGWSVPVLLDAAEQAMTGDDAAGAVRLLELALRDGDQRLEVTKALVRALWWTNPSAAAAHIGPLHAAMWVGELRGRDAVTLVRHALWTGDQDTALRALGMLADAPEPLDPQSAAELRMIAQWFHGRGPVAAAAEALSAEGDDPWTATARTLGAIWTGQADGATVAAAELILSNSWPGHTAPEMVATALLILAHGGGTERAAEWCERLAADAARRGAPTWQAMVEGVRADIALRRGEAVAAAARAEAAMGLLLPQGWGVSIGYPLSILIAANTVLGRHAVVEQLMRLRVPEAMFDTLCGLRYLHARGRALMATGRVLAAISDFQNCGRRMRAWGVDLPALVPWRTHLAEANLLLGRPDVADRHLSEQLRMPGCDKRTRGESLRLLAAAREPAHRSALLREAVECLRDCGDRAGLARAMADLGAATPGGEPARAIADWADPVLSESERRVAELAATGHTNREIGRALYITVSTVEQHLTRVYRKLGVTGRADLPHRLASAPVR